MKKYFNLLAVFSLITFLIAGCSGGGSTTTTVVQGSSPVIRSLSVQGLPAAPGSLITTTVIAQSAQNLALTYTWTAYNGWSVTNGSNATTATFKVPDTYGTSGTVTVQVTDSYNRYAVNVIPVSTYLEFLPSITVSPQPVITSTTLTCNGYYPLDNDLTFNWTVGGLPVTTGNPAVWYSPGLPGDYIVSVTVENGKDGIAISTTTPIQVNSLSPWPKFHRDIQSTGLSPINTSSITGTTKWSYATGGPIYSTSPTIGADGTIYVGSINDNLYAIH